MYAAQFHEGYEHIAKLKLTHMIVHSGSTVRVVPKLDETMIRALQPLPTWARYSDTRKTTIICDSAATVVDVLASCRSLTLDSPWKEVVFPRIKWMNWTRKQRAATHETAQALHRRVLDLDDQGISLVAVSENDDLFLSIYYDPEEEENE
jgi:hypothetical protein